MPIIHYAHLGRQALVCGGFRARSPAPQRHRGGPGVQRHAETAKDALPSYQRVEMRRRPQHPPKLRWRLGAPHSSSVMESTGRGSLAAVSAAPACN